MKKSKSTRTVQRKIPSILLLADVPDWIFERHCNVLKSRLSDEFDFTIQYLGQPVDESRFDLIYPLEWNLIKPDQIHDPHKYVTGIRSHLWWPELDLSEFTRFLAEKFQRVHVVSRRLYDVFHPYLPTVACVSHGVDTEFFRPAQPADQSGRKLRLGWAGNRAQPVKGFADFIQPLSSLPGVELVICGYKDHHLTQVEMVDFYNSIDAYVCASSQEGHNNPLMEAAAMQRAIITTDNGTVPEYLRHGESALIVERCLPSFIQAVETLRDDPELRVRLGKAARASIVNGWDWKQKAEDFRIFFRGALLADRPARAQNQPVPVFAAGLDDFDESSYLDRYPDVAAAVQAGRLRSGQEHFEKFGRQEGRVSFPARFAFRKSKTEGSPLHGKKLNFAILTHNALEYTQKCLQSIARNTPVPHAIFVLDNASTDDTPAWLKQQALHQPNLHCELSATNLGVPGGRNKLIEIVRPYLSEDGFIIFLDNDIELLENWYLPYLSLFDSHPEVGIASAQGHIFIVREQDRELVHPTPFWTAPVDVAQGGFACWIRAETIRAVGQYDENLGLFWHEDDDYCVRALAAGYDVYKVSGVPIIHHEHKSGLTQKPVAHRGSPENQRYLVNKWRRLGYVDANGRIIRRPLVYPVDAHTLAQARAADTLMQLVAINPEVRAAAWARQQDLDQDLIYLVRDLHDQAQRCGNVELTNGLNNLLAAIQQAQPPAAAPLATYAAPTSVSPARRDHTPVGVNVIGYVTGNLGLGTLARNTLKTLVDNGVPVSALDLDPGLGRGGYDHTFDRLVTRSVQDLTHPINLFILPPPTISWLGKVKPELFARERLNVALPMWELTVLPQEWIDALQPLDVVLAETHFIEQTFAACLSGIRIIFTPPALYLPGGIRPDRKLLGLPDDAVAFVTSFEPHSDVERKNPLAVLSAFQSSVGNDPRAHLFVRLNNAQSSGQVHPIVALLQQHCAENPRIHLLTQPMSYLEVLGLYASCDVYVSLHRAEGLGLGPMEAMFLGKPVIATAWSGNMTFMNYANSCPVGYRLIPVKGTIPAYQKEYLGSQAVWADADVADAGKWMRRLVDSPELRQQIGARAAEDLRKLQAETSQGSFIEQLQVVWQQRHYQQTAPGAVQLLAGQILQRAESRDWQYDIVIPIYGQAELLKTCVESLLTTTEDAHLILVDDCSPGNEIRGALAAWEGDPRVTLARTAQNSGFVGACRAGAVLGEAPYLLFLNSDTQAIEPGWLDRLKPQADDVAVAGAKLLYPPGIPGPLAGKVQHAGVARNAQGIPYHPFLGWDAGASEVNCLREVNAVTGACFLVRRKVWDELGGWDERFGKGVYEDVDFCWRARKQGYLVIYQPEAVLYHKESASKAPDGRHQLNEHTQENRQKLLARWKPQGSDEALFYGEKTLRRWDKARRQIEKARNALESGNQKSALALIHKAVEAAPDLPEAQIGLGQLLAARGDHSGAAVAFERAVTVAPAHWEARLRLVDEWMTAGHPQQAARELAGLLEVFPNAAELSQRREVLAPFMPSVPPGRGSQVDEKPGLAMKPHPPAVPFPPNVGLSKAARHLAELLESNDLPAALAAHTDWMDEEMLKLIRLNARAAQAEGQDDLTEGLESLAQAVEEVLAPAPVTGMPAAGRQDGRAAETYQLLLEADDLPAALEIVQDRLDADLLALVRENALIAQSEQNPELADGLDRLAEYIAEVIASQVKGEPRGKVSQSAGLPAAPVKAEEMFQILLNADDLAAALRDHRDRLDQDLIVLVQQNAQSARQDGNADRAEALDRLANYIDMMIASAPGARPSDEVSSSVFSDHTVQLFERLVNAPDILAELQTCQDELNDELIVLIGMNSDTARQDRNDELADLLENLAFTVSAVIQAKAEAG